MAGYDENANSENKYSTGICKKLELLSKSNGEDGDHKHISCNEHDHYRSTFEEELKRKQELLHHTQGVSSIDHAFYQADQSVECQSNVSPTSSEKKRKSDTLLDNFIPKKIKHCRKSTPDGLNLLQKEERSESSGKRSRDSYYSELGVEGEALCGDNDNSASKRRKIGQAPNGLQLKILGPLKLPDYVGTSEFSYEHDPEIIKLNKQLLEINAKLRAPSVYDEIGFRLNTKENKLRLKLGHQRQQIIRELNLKNPFFRPLSDHNPSKFSRKLYIPVKQFPNYNFIGLIIGPRGHTQKRMERESGARILLRGKGSTRLRKTKQYKDLKTEQIEEEDLHVYIEAEDEISLNTASDMVEKLLVPVNEEVNKHKQAQLRELAELNMELSSKVNEAPSLNPAASEPTLKIADKSHQPARPFSPNHAIESEAQVLTDTNPGERIDTAKLFVRFLPLSVDTKRLTDLFSRFGCVCEAVVIMDRRTGLSKGYGFVRYTDHISASKALAHMNGSRVDGKLISVRFAGRGSLKFNTVIGPRAQRFAKLHHDPISETACTCPFCQGVVIKGWNHWALLSEPSACYRRRSRPHVFPDFVSFPCYHQQAHPEQKLAETSHGYF